MTLVSILNGDITFTKDTIEGEIKISDVPVGGDIALNDGFYSNYPGPYEFTPSQEEQIIDIAYQRSTKDIKINPIPSYYGLITWNGSVLTVS